MRKRINAFKLTVHTDKIVSLSLHLPEETQQRVFEACASIIIKINDLARLAYLNFDAAKRALEREKQATGLSQRWQETDSTFGWWLIEKLGLDFLVLATSDIKWYAAGTYDDIPDSPASRTAFPVHQAQQWMMELMGTQHILNLPRLIWKAYAWKHRIPDEHQPDSSALNGFTIYLGILNRVLNSRWKQRLDMAMSSMRAICNPIIWFWCTAEALPCPWAHMRLLTDHLLRMCTHSTTFIQRCRPQVQRGTPT